MEFNQTRLRRWRRLALIRERDRFTETGRPCCQLSSIPFPLWSVQVHHVYPKALYPEKAYDLDNAAVIMTGLHYQCIHAGNATKDLFSIGNWKEFVIFFNRQNNLAFRRKFNQKYQGKI